jgi:fumarate reductase flavoprotein subunit
MELRKKTRFEGIQSDIIVIGGGGAGLAAAVAAAEKGADVILLEKRRAAGGNTALARGMFAAESPVQKRLKIDAQRDELFKTAMNYSHWTIDPKIFRAFVNKSGDTIQWLEQKGLKFEDVLHYHPNQVPRVFHVPEGRGARLVKLLVKKCEELGVRMLYKTSAKKILVSDKGRVTGIMAAAKEKEFTISGKSIIIATGGYSGNKELLKKYYSHYTQDLCLYGLPNMGDGLLMATEIGADTEGLGILQLRGPRFPESSYISVVLEEPNTVWVNKTGERFVDEATALFYWPESANALNRQPDKVCYSLFDEEIKQFFVGQGVIKGTAHFPTGTKMVELGEKLQSEADKKRVKISNSWEQIAEWIGASPKVLESTVKEYNSSCEKRHDELFAKDPRYIQPLGTPPYYAVKGYQSFHGTMGGIKINDNMEVVNGRDKPIPGLYAAGSDTGGWESNTYCIKLPGSTFGFAINSGRIAGENAALYSKKRQKTN